MNAGVAEGREGGRIPLDTRLITNLITRRLVAREPAHRGGGWTDRWDGWMDRRARASSIRPGHAPGRGHSGASAQKTGPFTERVLQARQGVRLFALSGS